MKKTERVVRVARCQHREPGGFKCLWQPANERLSTREAIWHTRETGHVVEVHTTTIVRIEP